MPELLRGGFSIPDCSIIPSLVKFLLIRLFGTSRLALVSSLWLAGTGLLGALPGVVLFLLKGAVLYGIYLLLLVDIGLIFFIFPGLIIAAIGLGLGSKYWLAQDDVAFNDFFSNNQ